MTSQEEEVLFYNTVGEIATIMKDRRKRIKMVTRAQATKGNRISLDGSAKVAS